MSHGSIDLSGSRVFGWFTLDVTTEYVKRLGQDIQDHTMELAKQAARGVLDQNGSFGVVLIMNVATGWAQGSPNTVGGKPGPGVFADWRRVDGRNLDGSLGTRGPGGGNGTEIFGQEMGHGYGLGHSRRDGSDDDYQDCWDIMSTENNCTAPDLDYDARGPGLNAWNMRGRGWLDESRVWRGPGNTFSEVVELRPLHRRDLYGWLAAELPPNDGVGGHGRYLVEFRIKEEWDAGIPRSAILVHRYLDPAPLNDGYPGRSYIMSGTQGNQDLVEGDVFAPGVNGGRNPRVEVLKINENDKVATVRLSCMPFSTRILDTGTTFPPETDGVWLMADYDRDGIPDLVFIKTSNTGTGTVEVHIASGASTYQTRILDVGTAYAPETDGVWLMADYDRDGIPDLVFIKTGNTGTGTVEVRIASGVSKYQTRILDVGTTFAPETDGVWLMADYDRDGIPDLVFIKTRNTGTGTVEVHIAS